MKKGISSLSLKIRKIFGVLCIIECIAGIFILLNKIFATKDFFKLPDNIKFLFSMTFTILLFGFFAYLLLRKPKTNKDNKEITAAPISSQQNENILNSVVMHKPNVSQEHSINKTISEEIFNEARARRGAAALSTQWLKIAQDCCNLVNTTVNPDVFFSRYDLMVEQFTKLSQVENYVKFTGVQPSVQLSQFLSDREYETELFINRSYSKLKQDLESLKTDTGKANKKAAYFTKMSTYSRYLSDKNQALLKSLSADTEFSISNVISQNQATDKILNDFEFSKTSDIDELNRMSQERSDKLYRERQNRISQFDPYSITEFDTSPLTSTERYFLKQMDGQEVKSPDICAYWIYEYSIDYDVIMSKLLVNEYLEIKELGFNFNMLTVKELQNILRANSLPVSGKKSELIKRITENLFPENLEPRFRLKSEKYTLTDKGQEAVKGLPKSMTKNLEFEDLCLKFIINYQFNEAYSAVCDFELKKIIPRGLGINWSKQKSNGLSNYCNKIYKDFLDDDVKYSTGEFNSYSKLLKSCIILGIMIGVAVEKICYTFIRVSGIKNTEKSNLTVITQKLQSQITTKNLESYNNVTQNSSPISPPPTYNLSFRILSNIIPPKEGFNILNENEQTFLISFEKALIDAKINPASIKLTRLSNGTFNVDHPSCYVGKINLKSQPFYMQYSTRNNTFKNLTSSNIQDLIDKIPAFIRYIKY